MVRLVEHRVRAFPETLISRRSQEFHPATLSCRQACDRLTGVWGPSRITYGAGRRRPAGPRAKFHAGTEGCQCQTACRSQSHRCGSGATYESDSETWDARDAPALTAAAEEPTYSFA